MVTINSMKLHFSIFFFAALSALVLKFYLLDRESFPDSSSIFAATVVVGGSGSIATWLYSSWLWRFFSPRSFVAGRYEGWSISVDVQEWRASVVEILQDSLEVKVVTYSGETNNPH